MNFNFLENVDVNKNCTFRSHFSILTTRVKNFHVPQVPNSMNICLNLTKL